MTVQNSYSHMKLNHDPRCNIFFVQYRLGFIRSNKNNGFVAMDIIPQSFV